MTRYKDIDGEIFGDYQIIGDTGKRDKNGSKIYIVRNVENGELYEGRKSDFINGSLTGYIGSEYHRKTVKKLNEKAFDMGVHYNNFTNHRNSKTGYHNVVFDNNSMRWVVQLIHKNNRYRKHFIDFKEAVIACQNYKIKNFNPLINEKRHKFKVIKYDEIYLNEYVKRKQNFINKYVAKNEKTGVLKRKITRLLNAKGTSYNEKLKKFRASIRIDGKTKHLGYFPTEQEAKEARQKAVDEQIKILEKQLEEL